MATIKTLVESARGCGYRKPGGLYLIGGSLAKPCGKLPIPLDLCPCCGAGIKFSRGFSWVSSKLIEDAPCSMECSNCNPFMRINIERYGLMWVGEKFYTTKKFSAEAAAKGISKRIANIPKGLVVGESWILLAHIKAIQNTDKETGEVTFKKGIFAAFIPQEIQYVVKGTETEEELDNMEKHGITLVRIIKDSEAQMQINGESNEQFTKEED